MKCGIYLITNLINNKKYVGQSLNIQKRWNQHCSAAFNPHNKGYDYPLYQAFRKYGINNFSFEILEECNSTELNDKEEYYIKFYNTLSNQGYNQALVGQGGATLTPAIVLSIIEELQYNTSDNTEQQDSILEFLDEQYALLMQVKVGIIQKFSTLLELNILIQKTQLVL